MTGTSNLFSRFAFKVGQDGKIDNQTRAFLSKFTGRIGPRIPDLGANANWQDIAITVNAIVKEFQAQGWIKAGFDAEQHDFQSAIRAVTMIPAATEFGYAPYEVFTDFITDGVEYLRGENGASAYGDTPQYIEKSALIKSGRVGNPRCDWQQSLDNLQAQVPNVGLVNMFVSWFGDDLRCGTCRLYPAVTQNVNGSVPNDWSVNGVSRYEANVVSQVSGGAAYGGTPDDRSVIDAIRDLTARKLKVAFTPFILMDIPAGNTKQDPYSGGTGQPVYPWRGRVTKAYDTNDKSAECAGEIAAFVAQYRTFVLHYASLCASAGGVDTFILGTELRGLTWLRDASGLHPFVNALKTLAADVAAILPAAKLTYAADWTEWFGFHPSDGTGDVIFHLDPLWSDPHIAAVSIDNYFPLSDWRDNGPNIDGTPGGAITDYSYLMGNVKGGEGYDWYYASAAGRTNQVRTPITDGAYGKPWVFRNKDIWSWWANSHYDRPGGVESATATAWVPRGKPIWFTEVGVPSVDKGVNQPNVFYDPKSSESSFPYFSTGQSDYTIQQRGLHSIIKFFDPDDPAFVEDNNPRSSVYSGRMLDPSRIMIYTWDARPYPAFPQYSDIWSDAPNWVYGHWIGGKLSSYTTTLGELNLMPLATTLSPRQPYIVDPTTGQLDKQWRDFFFGIEFVQGEPIPAVPLQPTAAEAASAINAVLAVLRAQKRIV